MRYAVCFFTYTIHNTAVLHCPRAATNPLYTVLLHKNQPRVTML